MPGSVSVRRRCMFSRASHAISEISVFMSVYMRAWSAHIYRHTYIHTNDTRPLRASNSTLFCTGAARGAAQGADRAIHQNMKFKVCAKGASEGAAPLLKNPISLFQPSGKSCGIEFVCQLTKGEENRAFRDLFLTDHPDKRFTKTGFTLKHEGGRWVHKPREKAKDSLSECYSFHRVDE